MLATTNGSRPSATATSSSVGARTNRSHPRVNPCRGLASLMSLSDSGTSERTGQSPVLAHEPVAQAEDRRLPQNARVSERPQREVDEIQLPACKHDSPRYHGLSSGSSGQPPICRPVNLAP